LHSASHPARTELDAFLREFARYFATRTDKALAPPKTPLCNHPTATILTGILAHFLAGIDNPIAELGKPAGESTRTLQFMQLTVDKDQPRIEGEALDFRNEVISQIRDSPVRKLVFNIEATDAGARKGVLVQRRTFPEGWQRIGRIEFHEAVASYNGDFVLHFPHPRWRTDDNDPRTVLRKGKQHSQGGGSAFHRPDRSA